MPVFQVSGELLHKISHALSSIETSAHHHHVGVSASGYFHHDSQEHEHPVVQGHSHSHSEGNAHSHPGSTHSHRTEHSHGTKHSHGAEHSPDPVSTHDHEFLESIKNLVNSGGEGDHEKEGDTTPFELDKHLLPLVLTQSRTDQYGHTENFIHKTLFSFELINTRGEPPRA